MEVWNGIWKKILVWNGIWDGRFLVWNGNGMERKLPVRNMEKSSSIPYHALPRGVVLPNYVRIFVFEISTYVKEHCHLKLSVQKIDFQRVHLGGFRGGW